MPNDKTLAKEAADKIGHECFPGNAVYSRGKAQGIIRQAITSANSDLRKENEELKRKMHSMQYESVCYGFRANCVSELCGGCLGCQIMQVQHSLELSDKEHKALQQKLSSTESANEELKLRADNEFHWQKKSLELETMNGEMRAWIENAPHTSMGCTATRCICGKQEALSSPASQDFVRVDRAWQMFGKIESYMVSLRDWPDKLIRDYYECNRMELAGRVLDAINEFLATLPPQAKPTTEAK